MDLKEIRRLRNLKEGIEELKYLLEQKPQDRTSIEVVKAELKLNGWPKPCGFDWRRK